MAFGSVFQSWRASFLEGSARVGLLALLLLPAALAAEECPYPDHVILGAPESTLEGSDVHRACATITLENGYTVGSSGQVLLTAGQRIVFQPGVRVNAGGQLRATVGTSPLILERYEVIGSDGGIVRDVVTGLEWMRCSQGQVWFEGQCVGQTSTFTFEGSKQRADTLNGSGGYGGHTDWRVPNVSDLRSLVYCSNTGQFGVHDWGCGASTGDYDSPTIAQAAFPNTPPSTFWSASWAAGYSDFAWRVHFGSGQPDWSNESITCCIPDYFTSDFSVYFGRAG